jgi:hypothetical protein
MKFFKYFDPQLVDSVGSEPADAASFPPAQLHLSPPGLT